MCTLSVDLVDELPYTIDKVVLNWIETNVWSYTNATSVLTPLTMLKNLIHISRTVSSRELLLHSAGLGFFVFFFFHPLTNSVHACLWWEFTPSGWVFFLFRQFMWYRRYTAALLQNSYGLMRYWGQRTFTVNFLFLSHYFHMKPVSIETVVPIHCCGWQGSKGLWKWWVKQFITGVMTHGVF